MKFNVVKLKRKKLQKREKLQSRENCTANGDTFFFL